MKTIKQVPVLTMAQVENMTPEEIKDICDQMKPPGHNSRRSYYFAINREGKFEFTRQIPVISVPKLPDEL